MEQLNALRKIKILNLNTSKFIRNVENIGKPNPFCSLTCNCFWESECLNK